MVQAFSTCGETTNTWQKFVQFSRKISWEENARHRHKWQEIIDIHTKEIL
jgi:hypothetical protein